jgi:hypothetical protein
VHTQGTLRTVHITIVLLFIGTKLHHTDE